MESGVSAFDFFFPGNAMTNSILATSYISIIPNLLLYFVPPHIKPASLNLLVNFAVGSLLGDVFLHLIPHAFMDHHSIEHVQPHSHDDHDDHDDHDHHDNKSLVIGLGIFAGMFLFYASDKIMREYFGKTGHDHSHKEDSTEEVVDCTAITDKTKSKEEGLRQRTVPEKKKKEKHVHKDIRASAYLNLLADFSHNLTDGIALSASFYASRTIGATTAVAVFFHEIPHEISDYAILIQSGFSKKKAMMAQFTTAIGAYIGTFIGIFIEEVSQKIPSHSHTHWNLGDLVIPVTAGGFIYIATVGVIPELLESKAGKTQILKELLCMLLGVLFMALIAMNEHHHH